ncbi:MAG: multidrug efflux RND transporter permease subunit [Hyphomicrobiales bacterium]|nr:multidrug efflux RND transporter permease subunit [Hyphomicrobiales bacterium]MCY4033964.1 multidrug efflux RND transporter permease subunit [Hyphomicrobiales bacterium]
MSGFFITRPIFAGVVAILTLLFGLFAIYLMPVDRFPPVAPPVISVAASYPGASAEIVAETVTTPLEQAINGARGMLYMSSSSANSGQSSISITFENGYDIDLAAVDVQNRIQSVLQSLPEITRRAGVRVDKAGTSVTLVVNLFAPDSRYDEIFLSNYADLHIVDVLSRVPGVGQVLIFGEKKYALRIWLDADKMAALQLAPNDVITAIQDQNQQVGAGIIGQNPAPQGQAFEYPLIAQGRLEEIEEFEKIIIRASADGSVLRLSDIATIELGAENYDGFTQFSNQPTVAIAVFQLPDANGLEVSSAVHEAVSKLSENFPEGVEYGILYDTTVYISQSISDVLAALRDAIILVVIVVIVFLHNWRSSIIPIIAIPVSLIGAFTFMLALGFSINLLTMLGIVLAVGLVVDDAIVVVENVDRRRRLNENTSIYETVRSSMSEVTGPILTTTAVLLAVFVPISLQPGVTGKLYYEFALTIAIALTISSFNSLTLSPALCALLFRNQPVSNAKEGSHWSPLTWFDRGFDRVRDIYMVLIERLIRARWIVMLVFFGAFGLTLYVFEKTPSSFLPQEDQGFLLANATLPAGSSLERTEAIAREATDIMLDTPGIISVITVGGLDLLNNVSASNTATFFIVLDSWDNRAENPGQDLHTILTSLHGKFGGIKDATVVPFNVPSIPELSLVSGFSYQLQDTLHAGPEAMQGAVGALLQEAGAREELGFIFTSYSVSKPRYEVDIDREKLFEMGIRLSDVFDALQVYLGSFYVNDFNKFGRVYRVIVQAREEQRAEIDDVQLPRIRSSTGEMIPLASLLSLRPTVSPTSISHHNLYPSVSITGAAAEGYSSSEAIDAMREVSEKVLPQGFSFEWSGVTFQEIRSSAAAPIIFALAPLMVFLFLAAFYESWTMPFMILLNTPMAVLGALLALSLVGLQLDVYAQIGIIMLVGLSAKNAILIVEFARVRREQGESIEAAALAAARDRLRPVLMTGFAFILGVIPLFTTGGAGAASRASIGITVFGGMLAATLLSILLAPVFYVVIQNLTEHSRFLRRLGIK